MGCGSCNKQQIMQVDAAWDNNRLTEDSKKYTHAVGLETAANDVHLCADECF